MLYKGYEIRLEKRRGEWVWAVHSTVKRVPPRPPLARFVLNRQAREYIDERTKNEPWSSMIEEFMF